MKRYAAYMAVALMLCAMTVITAVAKDKKAFVKFDDNLVVNNTVVKKGEYQVRFNEQTGELSILNGKNTVATAKAKLEKRDKKASNTTLDTRQNDKGAALISITLEGDSEAIVLE